MINSFGNRLTSLCVLADDNFAVSSGSDGAVVLWETKTGIPKEELLDLGEQVCSVAQLDGNLCVQTSFRVSVWKDILPVKIRGSSADLCVLHSENPRRRASKS